MLGWRLVWALSLNLMLASLSPAQDAESARGHAVFVAGRSDKALGVYRSALTHQNLEARYDLGLAYQQLGQHRKAARTFEDLLSLHPDYAKAHLPLGVSYYRLKKYQRAHDQLELAGAVETDRALVSYYKGLVAFHLGEYEEAPPKLLRALTLAPELERTAHYYSGIAYYKRGLLEEAREEFVAVKDLAPDTELSRLADDYLERVKRKERGIKPWSLVATVGVQFDDNVVLAPTDAVLAAQIARKADTRYLGLLRGGYEFLRTDRWIFDGAYQFYQNLHQTLREFDVQNHSAQLSTAHIRPWVQARLRYGFDYALLAEEPYFLVHTVNPTATWPLGGASSVQLQYRYQAKTFMDTLRIPTNSERTGSSHLAGLSASRAYAAGAGGFRGGYTYETETTDGPAWQSDAHQVTAGLDLPPLWTVRLSLTGEYLIRQYSNPDPLSPTGERRRDDALTGTATLSRPVVKHLDIGIQYLYNRNRSDLATFDFERNVGSVFLTSRW
ncbi:MAG: tetratricopeptide repeat protein [Nitrospirota bacterium]